MKHKLPQSKKSLKSFILDDDANVIDKAATKIALTSSFMALTIIANSNDAHAGHKDHDDHNNNLNAPENFGTGYHGGNNPLDAVVNGIQPKGVDTLHSNHFNHQDASGGESGIAMIIGAVVAVVVAFVTVGAGLVVAGAIGAAAGSFVTTTPGTDYISTGDPYYVPEEILVQLQDEES